MKHPPILNFEIPVIISTFMHRDDFESDQEWDDFVDKMLSSKTEALNQFQSIMDGEDGWDLVCQEHGEKEDDQWPLTLTPQTEGNENQNP